MKHNFFLLTVLFLIQFLSSWNTPEKGWKTDKLGIYNLRYTLPDKSNRKEYKILIKNGITSVEAFFHASFVNKFVVYIHPTRQSLDSTWQKDWVMPAFKSECWMVASGVATKLDILSPKLWDKQSCEHIYSETTQTQQLITHELVHVFHGQRNISPNFSNVEGIDWFVEGLATYASGQCDKARIADVKKEIENNKIPKKLDNFWSGKIKYGLSGSVVMFIDHKYGRSKIMELLSINKKSEILVSLQTTEAELLTEWQKYIQNL